MTLSCSAYSQSDTYDWIFDHDDGSTFHIWDSGDVEIQDIEEEES